MLVLDFVGVFAFALSGGLAGVRRRMDIFGILTLALLTALGGGITRDVLLGLTPPANLTNTPLIATALVGGMLPFLLMPSVQHAQEEGSKGPLGYTGTMQQVRNVVLVADAAGLAAFAVSGTMRAVNSGTTGIAAVVVGMITAVGGGMLRDVVSGKMPDVFGTELYAIPALLGALLTELSMRLPYFDQPIKWALVAFVFGLRLAAVHFQWHSPTPKRLRLARLRIKQ